MSIAPDQPPVTRHFDGPEAPTGAAPATDADLRPPTPAELDGTTALDLLRGAVSKAVRLEPAILRVPSRPGVSIEYDPNIEDSLLTAWRKRSIYEDPRDGINALKLASIVLASQCIGFLINGTRVNSGGHPLTFASQEVWQMVTPAAASSPEAVIRLYGVDAHVIQTGEEVLRAAGYGGLIEREDRDPTVLPPRS
jgi:hypothetical protein